MQRWIAYKSEVGYRDRIIRRVDLMEAKKFIGKANKLIYFVESIKYDFNDYLEALEEDE